MRRLERSNPMSNVVWINSGRDFRRTGTAVSGARSVPDSSFEFALERMFAETPARPDADFFAARVLERLDRGWTTRRLLIGSMGALGGVVGAYQIGGAGALQELSAAASRSNDFFNQHLSHDLTSAGALP